MAKFQMYDRVALNKDLEFYELLEDEMGTIMSDKIDGMYAVAFPFDDDVLHACNSLVPSGRGLMLDEEDLKRV